MLLYIKSTHYAECLFLKYYIIIQQFYVVFIINNYIKGILILFVRLNLF